MSELVAKLRVEAESAAAVAELQKSKAALGEVAQAAAQANKTIASEAARAEAAVESQAESFEHLRQAAAVDIATPVTAQLGGVAKGAKLTASEMLNLSRQFSDVGVTAAMGMNPLMIMIQQGPQIAETFSMAAGRGMTFSMVLKDIAASAWAAVAPLAPFIAAAAAAAAVVGGGLAIATHEMNKAAGDLTEGLGLTEKQLEKVKDRGITMGDAVQGAINYAGEALSTKFAPQIQWVQDLLKDAYQFILNQAVATVKGVVGGFGAGFAMIGEVVRNFGGIVSDALVTAANFGLSAIESLVNGAIGMLNSMIAKANAAAAAVGLSIRVPTLDPVSFQRLANQHAGAMANVGKAGVEGYRKAVAGLGAVWEGILDASKEVAQARIQEEAGTDKATRALKDHTAAVKDYTTVAPAMIADLSKVVDLMKVQAVKLPGRVDGLKNVAEEAGKSWEAYKAEGEKVIQDLGDTIEREFVKSGRLSFDSIGDYAEQQFRQAIYDTLLKEPIRVLINGVFSNLEGLKAALGNALGGSLGAILGSAGVGSAIGQSMGLGTGKGGVDTVLGIGGAAVGTALATSATMAAATAGMAGTMMGTLLTSASVLGPIGAIAALALGTLFKSKPSNNGALATLTEDTYSISGNKRTSETTAMATNAANAVLQGEQMLRNAGIKLNATVRELDLGTRDATDIVLSDGRRLTSAVGDAAAAAETGLKAVLEGATYANEAQESLVKSMLAAGKGFDDIAAALGQLKETQALPQTLADAILKLSDPKTFELNQLGRDQSSRRSSYLDAATEAGFTADALASLTRQLDTLEALELDQVLEKYGQAVGSATDRLEKANGLQTSINDAILKIVSPAAYQFETGRREIEAQISAMRTQAEALIASGDLTSGVLSQLDTLQNMQMAELARQVAETADTFAQARKTITSWLDSLTQSASAELSPAAQRAQALADYQRVLALAQGGDANAAGQITTYADRLLSADRSATDSAQSRLALFNQVRAEVAGLTGLTGSSDGLAAQLQTLALPLGQLLDVSKLTKVANDNVVMALTPSLKVTQADIPALGAMYGQVQANQTDRVVAAVEKLRTDLNTAMEAIRATGAASSSAVQTALDNLAAEVGGRLGELASATASNTDQLADIRRDGMIAASAANLKRAS